MRAEYDSAANALTIDILRVDRWDREATVHDTWCTVALSAGAVANVELLSPRDHLGLLDVAAERYGLDSEALHAAADAALAAPDREVDINVLDRAA